jgi:hypothetical protein
VLHRDRNRSRHRDRVADESQAGTQ